MHVNYLAIKNAHILLTIIIIILPAIKDRVLKKSLKEGIQLQVISASQAAAGVGLTSVSRGVAAKEKAKKRESKSSPLCEYRRNESFTCIWRVYPPALWAHSTLDPQHYYYSWNSERVRSLKHPLAVEVHRQQERTERNYPYSFTCRRHCGSIFSAIVKFSYSSLSMSFIFNSSVEKLSRLKMEPLLLGVPHQETKTQITFVSL